MVPPPASRERGLRRRPPADRERADDLPTPDRGVDDRSPRAAAPGPRARDRHRLRLPDGDPGAPDPARLHDRAAARSPGRGRGAIPAARPHEYRDSVGRRRTRLARARAVPEPLTEQLAPGGRLVIPVGDLASQELVILQRGPNRLVERRAGGVRFVHLISRLAFTEEPWA